MSLTSSQDVGVYSIVEERGEEAREQLLRTRHMQPQTPRVMQAKKQVSPPPASHTAQRLEGQTGAVAERWPLPIDGMQPVRSVQGWEWPALPATVLTCCRCDVVAPAEVCRSEAVTVELLSW